jgi:beta-N-acetylhexosaminidase
VKRNRSCVLVTLLVVVFAAILVAGCIARENRDQGEGKAKQPKDEKPYIDKLLEDMTLEEKLGQMMLFGFEGVDVTGDTADFINKYRPGGIILYAKNIESKEQVASLARELQKLGANDKGIGMFICTDQEGGRVSRLPGAKKYPSARELARDSSVEHVADIAADMAMQLKEMGINMNLAPVLDIDSNPNNPVIGDRAFGNNPDIVWQYAEGFIDGTQKTGVIPVVKHYPGHGDTSVDSHTGLPVLDHSRERVMDFEMIPFKKAVDKGVPAIMTAHIVFTRIDPEHPATMSKAMLGDILRQDFGYNGVVMTDDLDMAAIHQYYGVGNAAVSAINAGADILLVAQRKDSMIEVFDALKRAVDDGQITVDRIDGSVRRILNLKEVNGIINR